MPPRIGTVFAGWMAVLALAYALLPDARPAVRLLAGASAVVVIVVGMRRNRATDRRPWTLLAGAIGLSAVGTALLGAASNVGGVLILAAYPLLAAVLLIFIRRRTGGTRDEAALLDALVVTASLAMLTWTFVLGPRAGAGTWIDLAAPIGDLLCVGVLTRLLTGAHQPLPAGRWLGAGLALMLAANIEYEVSLLTDGTEVLAGLGRLALYAGAGLAALHPSMGQLSVVAEPDYSRAEAGRLRLAILGVACMAAPGVLFTKIFSSAEGDDLTVVAVLGAVTFLLVLFRMAGIMANHRLALARERGLRRASAALVSAADPDAVAAAVRIAIAQLLPVDTPHAVVLAMAIADDSVPTPVAFAQADADRAAGTAARTVATREVDPAASARLDPFRTTLRCPLVLNDRPTGDPLVGVLYVGAPEPALPGLRHALEVLAGQVALAVERIELSQEVIRSNSETYFRTLVQNTSDVILIVDDVPSIRYASPSALRLFGADPTGSPLAQVIHPDDRDRLTEVLASVSGDNLQEGQDFRAASGSDDDEVLLELHCSDLRAEPTVAGLVLTLRDVTERRRLEGELTHQAFHDAMTGLANRVLFHDRLGHALARGARDGSVVGVLFIDLDDFKVVNDTLGHAVGDQLLITVAHRIAGALRADDTAARLGGDEFAALVENAQDPGAVEETAERILAALAEPVVIDEETSLHAVASIGITTTPEADTADELLRQADLALYVAKGAGKNQWRRYQADLHDAMVQRLELRSALDHAVNEGHFLLVYQPIVDLISNEPVGFEALVRWSHPTQGVVWPAEFIEVSEESGLIVPLGRWVLQQALHTVAQWRRILPRDRQPYVSVNVSVRQFREPGFVDEILGALQAAQVPPQALVLELTETLLVGEHETIWQDLTILREHGIRIAIDDFGTGYSSLGYLRRRPIDIVKIDKTFIDDMIGGPQQLNLVAGIVSLAHSLDLTVIAEGIESPVHRDLLAQVGCQLGQGFFWSSPVDGTEALSQMTDRHPLVA